MPESLRMLWFIAPWMLRSVRHGANRGVYFERTSMAASIVEAPITQKTDSSPRAPAAGTAEPEHDLSAYFARGVS